MLSCHRVRPRPLPLAHERALGVRKCDFSRAHPQNKSVIHTRYPPIASKPQQPVTFQHSCSKRALYHSVDFTGRQTEINTAHTHTHTARDQKEFRVSKQAPPQKQVQQCFGSGIKRLGFFFSSANHNTALSFLLQGEPLRDWNPPVPGRLKAPDGELSLLGDSNPSLAAL